jgi:ketosteroid isomerase-like protein
MTSRRRSDPASAQRLPLTGDLDYNQAMPILIALAAAGAATTTPQCNAVPIIRMIADYAMLQQHQDGAAIAHLFGSDGVVENPGAAPIRGEAAIKALLAGFKGFVVTANSLTIDDVAADTGGWRVIGRFHQTGRTPEPKDYDVSGSFDSSWACSADGWRVRRMATGK